MLEFGLDKEEERIGREAAEYSAGVLQPRARENDESGVFPADLLTSMAGQGYLGATIPRDLGGLGLDPVAYGLLMEEIEKGCSNASRLITVQVALVGETILKFGDSAQIRRWIPGIAAGETRCAFSLTEPEVGSDAGGVRTKAEARGGGYVLRGRKKWISFAGIADLLVVFARLDDDVTAFVVEREQEGIEILPIKGLLGNRASHVSEIVLHDVAVPGENVLGRVGQGFSTVATFALDQGRYSIAWSGVGLAQASLDAMARYARKREQFGRKIGSFQLIQGKIADAVTNTHAARNLCLRAGELRRAGRPEAIPETAMAKYFASSTAFRTASDAVQVHGGAGCSGDFPVERYLREAKILEIIEGTSQIQQTIIALHGMRQYGRDR